MKLHNTKCHILKKTDLTEAQMYVTIETLNRHATEYAKKWEWNPHTIQEITKYNINPFLKYAKPKGNVLIVGSRCGRDLHFLTQKGFSCLGTEFSYGLLEEALRRVPHGMFIRLDPRSLPFISNSFDAVYADDIAYLPIKNIKKTIRDFKIFLRDNGILYLSFRTGQNSILIMNEFGEKRYIALYKKNDITDFIKSVGFTIIWKKDSPHTDPDLPSWHSLIARKK